MITTFLVCFLLSIDKISISTVFFYENNIFFKTHKYRNTSFDGYLLFSNLLKKKKSKTNRFILNRKTVIGFEVVKIYLLRNNLYFIIANISPLERERHGMKMTTLAEMVHWERKSVMKLR